MSISGRAGLDLGSSGRFWAPSSSGCADLVSIWNQQGRPVLDLGSAWGILLVDVGKIWAPFGLDRSFYFAQFLLDPDSIWGGDWGRTSENMLLLFSRCHQFIHCFIWPALQSIPILIPQQSRWVRHLTASSSDVLHTQNICFLLSSVDAPLEKHEYAHAIARGLPLGNWSVA